MADPANDAVSVMMSFGQSSIPVAKDLAELFIDAIKVITQPITGAVVEKSAEAVKNGVNKIDFVGTENKVRLKNLVHESKDLLSIPVEREDLKAIQKQLKKYRVTFAVMKDSLTDGYSVHVKGEDYPRIEEALKGVLKDMTKEQTVVFEKDAPMDSKPKEESTTVGAKQDEAKTEIVEEREPQKQERAEGITIDVVEKQTTESIQTEQPNEQVRKVHWSQEFDYFIDADGEPIKTQITEKQLDNGYKLEAIASGRANVVDYRGKTVWTGATVANNMSHIQRLAERGFEAYEKKDELRLDQENSGVKTPSEKFDEKLDTAEAIATKEAMEKNSLASVSPHRVKENARG